MELDNLSTIKEGKATLVFEKAQDSSVFYNPAQEFNRDLTIAAIKTWSKQRTVELLKKAKDTNFATENGLAPFTCLDALSATGLRAIRYAKEIPEIKYVVANDYDGTAIDYLKRNLEANELAETKKVVVSNADANYVMYRHAMLGCPFDVIDLDPYGTAAPFLEAAIASISDGGLLCVTSTDMICLGGRQPGSCFTKYGGISVPQSPYCHEIALRIVLQTIAVIAARHKKAIEPLISASADFYIRLFVRVHSKPVACKILSNQLGIAYCCSSCTSFSVQPFGKSSNPPLNNKMSVHEFPRELSELNKLKFGPATGPPVNRKCDECGGSFHVAGPLYLAPLYNAEFLSQTIELVQTLGESGELKQFKSIECMLTLMSLELRDCPFFYRVQHITRFMHVGTPSLTTIYSALLNSNYRVSPTHCTPGAFKTDAPASFVFDILKRHMESVDKAKFAEKVEKARLLVAEDEAKASPGMRCLSRDPVYAVDFTFNKEAQSAVRGSKEIKYPSRPKNWGPKARASENKAGGDQNTAALPKRSAPHPIQLAQTQKEYLPPNFFAFADSIQAKESKSQSKKRNFSESNDCSVSR